MPRIVRYAYLLGSFATLTCLKAGINFFLRQIATRNAHELRPRCCSNKRFTYENNYQPFLQASERSERSGCSDVYPLTRQPLLTIKSNHNNGDNNLDKDSLTLVQLERAKYRSKVS